MDEAQGSGELAAALEGYERSLILAALAAVGGRRRSAAVLLGTPARSLAERMARLGLRAQRAARRHLASAGGPPLSRSLGWRGRVPPGGVLEIRSVNGPVRVEASDDERVHVAATRRGPRAVLAALELAVVAHGRSVTVCTQWRALDPATSPRAARRLSRRLADAHVEIVVRAPRAIRIVASTFGGDVEVVGMRGVVEAAAANGRVRFVPDSPLGDARTDPAEDAPAAATALNGPGA
jgi:hypothetical protein